MPGASRSPSSGRLTLTVHRWDQLTGILQFPCPMKSRLYACSPSLRSCYGRGVESLEQSIELAQFYRTVSNWPQADSELAVVAARVARLCRVPFAAIHSSGQGLPGETVT